MGVALAALVCVALLQPESQNSLLFFILISAVGLFQGGPQNRVVSLEQVERTKHSERTKFYVVFFVRLLYNFMVIFFMLLIGFLIKASTPPPYHRSPKSDVHHHRKLPDLRAAAPDPQIHPERATGTGRTAPTAPTRLG